MWNGVFAPRVTKHRDFQHDSLVEHIRAYGKKVRFIRLVDMTAHDWDVLDYDNVRDVARNRIADMMLRRELIGFLRIEIHVENGKEAYYQPVTRADVEDFEQRDKINFGNYRDADSLSDAAELVEDYRASLSIVPRWMLVAMGVTLRVVARNSNEEVPEEIVEQLEQITRESLFDLSDAALILLLIVLLFVLLGREKFERVINDIPDEVDTEEEFVDWLAESVGDASQGSSQIAAGRGLTP